MELRDDTSYYILSTQLGEIQVLILLSEWMGSEAAGRARARANLPKVIHFLKVILHFLFF